MSFDQEQPRGTIKESNQDNEADLESSDNGEGETPSYSVVPKYSTAYVMLLAVLLLCVFLFALLMGYMHYNSLQNVKEEFLFFSLTFFSIRFLLQSRPYFLKK